MPEYVRVRDKLTGHQYSVPKAGFDPARHDELPDKRAVDAGGRPLPAKHHIPAAKAADESEKDAGGAADPQETPTPAGRGSAKKEVSK